MDKNRKLFVILVFFLIILCCVKCVHADGLDVTPTIEISPSSSPSPTSIPETDYSVIVDKIDDLMVVNQNSNLKLLISIWALIGLTVGYSVIKDTF